MKKLFISQPMADKTEEEILREREQAIKKVEKQLGEKVKLIDSFIDNAPKNHKNISLWYLAKSLEFLAEADVAYFVDGWQDYRGCKIEYQVATEYGVKIIINNEDKLCLWKFYWDCGRQGEVQGIFKATKQEIEDAIGRYVYFGEILGKHSEVSGTIEEGEITLISDDPIVVEDSVVSGYNPLDYLQYQCPICGYMVDVSEWDFENGICDYCAKN